MQHNELNQAPLRERLGYSSFSAITNMPGISIAWADLLPTTGGQACRVSSLEENGRVKVMCVCRSEKHFHAALQVPTSAPG